MKNYRFLFAAGISLALAFTFSCSGDSSGGGNGDQPNANSVTEISSSSNTQANGDESGLVRKEKISGFSQKGPFVRGSSITLFELDSNVVQTGKSFQSTISDDKGSFEINSVSLISPYVRLKTDGYYYNEISGKKSSSPITLYAIADLTNKSSLNVNLLTHLEYEKVQKLVESGESFSKAKKQAQQDILKAFGINGDFASSEDMSIFGSSEGSAILLAISILLQGDRDEASFTDLLTDFNQSIKNSIEWSIKKKTELADWASGTDLGKIRANINGWGLPYEVPIFERYIRKFWSDNYGLGECKDKGREVKNDNPLSANQDRYYVCNGSYWESIDNLSSASGTETSKSSSSIMQSSSSSSATSVEITYYCDYGPKHTCPSCTDGIGGGCIEMENQYSECDLEYGNVVTSCSTGLVCDWGARYYDPTSMDCGDSYCGGCYVIGSLSGITEYSCQRDNGTVRSECSPLSLVSVSVLSSSSLGGGSAYSSAR